MNSINIKSCKIKKLTLSKITFREIGYFKIEMTKIWKPKMKKRARVAQWVRWLDYLTTHTSLSPIRRGFAPGFVNYKREHSTRNRKWYSLPVACPWSVVFSGYSCFFHHKNWSPWYRWNIAESGIKHTQKKHKKTKMKNLPNDIC